MLLLFGIAGCTCSGVDPPAEDPTRQQHSDQQRRKTHHKNHQQSHGRATGEMPANTNMAVKVRSSSFMLVRLLQVAPVPLGP